MGILIHRSAWFFFGSFTKTTRSDSFAVSFGDIYSYMTYVGQWVAKPSKYVLVANGAKPNKVILIIVFVE